MLNARSELALVFRRPDRFLLVVGLLAGFIVALLTPPFHAPDEPDHFFRAYAISTGRVTPVFYRGYVGEWVPYSLVSAVRRSTQDFRIRNDPDRKINPRTFLSMLGDPLSSEPVFGATPLTAVNAPFAYVPAAVEIAVGRWAGGSPLILLYLARLGGMAVWTLLFVAAVRAAPRFQWLLVVIALSPLCLFLRSVLSHDGFTMGAAWLFTAMILGAAESEAPLPITELKKLAGAALLLGLGKAGYGLLSLLVFLVPRSRFRNAKQHAAFIGIVVGAAFLGSLHGLVDHRFFMPHESGIAPSAQLRHVMSAPFSFLGLWIAHMVRFDFVGDVLTNIGWLDVPFPFIYKLAAWALILLAVAREAPEKPWSARARLLVIGLCVATALAVAVIIYTHYDPVGAPNLFGYQARYFLPFLPALLMALAPPKAARRVPELVFPVASLVLFVGMVAIMMKRFYP